MVSLIRVRKSNNYCYHESWKSDNLKDGNQEKKYRTDTVKEAEKIKSDKFMGSGKENSNNVVKIGNSRAP